ncbi:MAG: SseB family protein [Fusicatenibacter saccharivorans]|uniref:SseB family protein n=1 Tax=Fusicatenibacter saccharivorans TaxID=1150298 RepID=UPI002A8CE8EA|nr:SseB family protein [Fusicatenibacter saccharivorans]MDY5072999.1 SseB family protein [Fusicatenibacter saccharivorans]
MAKETDMPKDEGLQGNETIEEAILGLQKEPTPELLAHVLTVIRRRMKEGGQAILSVEPPSGDDQIRIGTVKSADGKVWWAAFTSFEEELKGAGSVKSTFLVSLEQLIRMASETKEISGVILNPWNRTIMLDHTLLSIIIGEENAGH